MDEKYIVAFEVSSSQIKGAVASVHKVKDAAPTSTVESLAVIDDTSSVRYGRIQNIADASKFVMSIRQGLQECPVLDGRPIVGAYVGVEGRSIGSVKITATLELPTEMEITPEIMKRLYAEAAKIVSPDKKTLQMMPRKYIVDNQTMNNPVGAPASKLRGEFTAVVCNPVNIKYLDMVFRERCQIPEIQYVVTPIAVADTVLSEEEKQLGCVLVDFGYQTTTLSIYKDRALQYLATLPLGSQNITLDIAALLNCTVEKAENIKKDHADAMGGNEASHDMQLLNSYVQVRAIEIIENINAQIEHAGYRAADFPGGMIITGRAVKLRNFDRLLETNAKMKVRGATISKNISFRQTSPDVIPTDYLSLLAIINRAARSKDILECVETAAAVQEAQTVQQEPLPAQQQVQRPATARPVRQVEDDDTLLQDDPVRGTRPGQTGQATQPEDPGQTEGRGKRRSGLFNKISKIKNDLASILSSDDENI